jgi:hypothetical protein
MLELRGLLLQLFGSGTHRGGDNPILEEGGKPALAGGFPPQFFGRAALGKHSNLSIPLIRTRAVSVPPRR